MCGELTLVLGLRALVLGELALVLGLLLLVGGLGGGRLVDGRRGVRSAAVGAAAEAAAAAKGSPTEGT